MTLTFVNARLIDPEAGTETPGDLLVADRRIAALGAVAAPSDAEVIDCGGKPSQRSSDISGSTATVTVTFGHRPQGDRPRP